MPKSRIQLKTEHAACSGCLVLVTGPSGAGKDSILTAAAKRLHGDPRYIFPKRFVTRVSNPDEDHISVGIADFTSARSSGHFALDWEAHGLSYAVPATIVDDLGAGRIVVCNVSRSVVDSARDRFGRVLCIEITAPLDVLRKRLATRGRESATEIDRRLERQTAFARSYKADVTIDNSAPLDTAVAAFVEALATAAPSH